MGKWKNLFKKQHAQTQLKNDDFVTVQVNPDAYQVILTIAKDSKNKPRI
jgi:hypothetical protein